MDNKTPSEIKVIGAKVHNLKNINVDIPLNQIVGIAGVSGSGKSSLALGVLYAEGSRRYLDSLSTYTRRRMSFSTKANVDDVLYIPATLALHQRPGVPNIRSTFGTGTELLNSLRLMFSRLSHHCCPNGHYLEPTLNVASEKILCCPVCNEKFWAPSAEELAFNSQGACKKCGGVGVVMDVDIKTLIPDENLTIDQGAVAPWNSLMWSLMTDVCRAMGVRTDIPFKDLTDKEKDIVYNGKAEKKHIFYKSKTTNVAGEMDFTYYSAINTVKNALAKVKDEKGMKRVEKFLKESVCDECNGSRLCEKARLPKIKGISIDGACKMTLTEIIEWVKAVPDSLPEEMRPMAKSICDSFLLVAKRLVDLGLGYLTLDRASSTLSTGERQRMQLARAVRNRTTGVLYILDEPSIGLHPANVEGLKAVMHDLVNDGNSVVLVDHDAQILNEADYLIEMGKKSGINGGNVITNGKIKDVLINKNSQIAPFLSGEKSKKKIRPDIKKDEMFKNGEIYLSTGEKYTLKPLEVIFPKGRLTAITGVSGSGKTTLILESLIPALKSKILNNALPEHIKDIKTGGIKNVKLIDATPIGINVRSTIATYANIHDELRKLFEKTDDAKNIKYKASDFSYNTGKLRCTNCDGTGEVNLDVQFLPDVDIPCPECRGSRYSKEVDDIKYMNKEGKKYSIAEIMAMDINTAMNALKDVKIIYQRLKVLQDLGIGYLTLGEATTNLSGGEAQRLKLATEMGKQQDETLFVFDEPTIGLHPLDVYTLISVFQSLIEKNATIIVIEHDLDLIKNADYIIDMGPSGGKDGGRIIAKGTQNDIKNCKISLTGKYL